MMKDGVVDLLSGYSDEAVQAGLYQYCKDHGNAGSVEKEVQWAIEEVCGGLIVFDRAAKEVYTSLVAEDLTLEVCVERLELEVEL